jgi:hypothetical protein
MRPTEPQDWWPLLDEALSRLTERHRAPVVLCDLQGLSRREAARQLGLPNRTLSNRLVKGRMLLAQRLSRRGVTLSGGALAALLSEEVAYAHVRAALVLATARAASLVAAGHLAAVATPVAALTMGVLRAMWIAKVKVVVAAVFAVAALGAGVAYHSEVVRAEQIAQVSPAKPRSELEALRRENELLKLNLEVVLEKVRALENEVRALRGKNLAPQVGLNQNAPQVPGGAAPNPGGLNQNAPQVPGGAAPNPGLLLGLQTLGQAVTDKELDTKPRPVPDATRQAEEALRALREAKDDASRRRALEALDRALRTLRQQIPGARHDEKKPG